MFMAQDSNTNPAQGTVSRAIFAEYSDSPKPVTSDPASSLCSQINLQNATVRIESVFTVNALKNWINVFQTDNANQGVRLEINKKGTTALLMPISEEGKFSALIFKNETLRVGTKNSFSAEITIRNMIEVKAQLNGELKSMKFPYSLIGCDRMLNGGGYSNDRELNGPSVTQISLVKPSSNKFFGIGLSTHRLVSVILLVFLFFILLISLSRRKTTTQFDMLKEE